MKTVKQLEAEQHAKDRKKLLLFGCSAAALLLIGIVVVFLLLGRGRATVNGTLEQYFGTMYSSNGKGFDEMKDCFAPDLQEQWYNSMTMYGMSFTQLTQWRLEATEQVGDNAAVRTRVTETVTGTGTELATMRQTYAGAEALCDVIFTMNVDGDTGAIVAHGTAELVKLNGKWYFTATSIPVTVESRTGSAQEWFDKYGETTEGTGN